MEQIRVQDYSLLYSAVRQSIGNTVIVLWQVFHGAVYGGTSNAAASRLNNSPRSK